MKLVIFLAIVAYVSAAACADGLSQSDCESCSGGTHIYACTDKISTCLKCDSTTAKCSAECEGKGFISAGSKCLACGQITGCPNSQVSCALATGNTAVKATSLTCKQCMPTHFKVAGDDTKTDKCADVSIPGCLSLHQQTCTPDATSHGTCKANTKVCSKCDNTSFRDEGASGTRDDACTPLGSAVMGCDTETKQTCTVTGSAGSKSCTPNTVRCSKCATDRLRYDASSATAKASDTCLDLVLAGCKSGSIEGGFDPNTPGMLLATSTKCKAGGAEPNYIILKSGKTLQVTGITSCIDATCTEDSASLGNCKSGTKVCKACAYLKFPVKLAGEDGKCQDDVASCLPGKTTCTAATASACTAGSKRCSECLPTHQKVTNGANGSSDDVCVDISALILDCSKGSCTITANTALCEANSARCTECPKTHQLMTPPNANNKCVDVAITDCVEATCEPDTAKTACKANTKRCVKCLHTTKKTVTANADDTCPTCVGSAACDSTCTGTISKTGACILASTAAGDDLRLCSTAKSNTEYSYVTTRSGCYNSKTVTCGAGTCLAAVYHASPKTESSCSRCSIYSATSTYTPMSGGKTAVDKLTTCAKCSATACTEGTCADSLKLASNKCSAAGGGAGGNGTGNSTNSTGSTITSVFASAVAVVVVLLA